MRLSKQNPTASGGSINVILTFEAPETWHPCTHIVSCLSRVLS
jgi:hypothetical protein